MQFPCLDDVGFGVKGTHKVVYHTEFRVRTSDLHKFVQRTPETNEMNQNATSQEQQIAKLSIGFVLLRGQETACVD